MWRAREGSCLFFLQAAPDGEDAAHLIQVSNPQEPDGAVRDVRNAQEDVGHLGALAKIREAQNVG